MKKTLYSVSKILVNVFVWLFAVIMVGGAIALDNVQAISKALKAPTQRMETVGTPDPNEDLEYFKSEFNTIADMKANTEKYTQDIAKEGSVLLKNEKVDGVPALPLSSGDTVSLFSISSVSLVYAGTGSSGTNTSSSVDLKDALEADDIGLTVNQNLWNWYTANLGRYGRGSAGGAVGQTFAIKEAPWSAIGAGTSDPADAAIFVLARNGGEGADLTVSGGSTSDMTDGNYLKLSPQETDVLEHLKSLKDSGQFGKIIVLLNSANQVESKFIDDERFGIDAALWIGDVGSTGIRGVASVLVGKTNPSGRLADTFWYEHYQNPVMSNFGNYTFSGSKVFDGDTRSNSYVVYQEGIYVGYRYTETRYEDFVMNDGNPGDFDYDKVVAYPFGYGLSYSTFEYSGFKVTPPLAGEKEPTYTVTLNVHNNGPYPGKEVVQIYLQKPYTDYDREHGIEKAAVDLVGFAKTDVIPSGEDAKVTVKFKEREFASYDADGAGTYIMDAGSYYITAAKNAHDAVNNILKKKGYTPDGESNTALVEEVKKSFGASKIDDKTYSTAAATGAEIVNRFDNADLNRYDGKGDNSVTYVTRSDWEGTVKLGYTETNTKLNNHVVITGTEQMRKDVMPPAIEKDDKEYPTYGAENGLSLIDLRAYYDEDNDVTNDEPIPYDDPSWDELLDQLTWDETVLLLSDGFRRTVLIESINKPETIDHNGATGPTQKYNDNSAGEVPVNRGLAVRLHKDDPDINTNPTIYPCNGLVASTFDQTLSEEFGKAMGNDCLWAGYNGLYGFGINTHRSTYGGRTFEYYSEDPVLAGLICAAETRGIQAYGCNVYLKHCVLNDQERSREGICTWANEQTIREVYLRSFQIAVEEGGAMNIMTGFNRLGVVWTGHQGFVNTVMHGEFDMKGCAVSDWFQNYYMTLAGGVLGGNDIPDASKSDGQSASSSELNAYKTGYGNLAWAMRESAHRILYHTVHSNVMNGINANTRFIKITPWWINVVTALKITSGVLMGLSLAFLAFTVTLKILDWIKEEKAKPKSETATATIEPIDANEIEENDEEE